MSSCRERKTAASLPRKRTQITPALHHLSPHLPLCPAVTPDHPTALIQRPRLPHPQTSTTYGIRLQTTSPVLAITAVRSIMLAPARVPLLWPHTSCRKAQAMGQEDRGHLLGATILLQLSS